MTIAQYIRASVARYGHPKKYSAQIDLHSETPIPCTANGARTMQRKLDQNVMIKFTPRSILFTTAHLQSMIRKAAQSHADAVCLDLEDGVPFDRKQEARNNLANAIVTIENTGKVGLIRINSELEHVGFDLAEIPLNCSAIVLPKTQGMQHIESLAHSLDRLFGVSPSGEPYGPGIVAMFESAASIQSMAQDTSVIANKRLQALSIGTEDLAADMSCEPSSGLICHAFDQLSMSSSRLGVSLIGFPDSIAEFKALNKLEEGVRRGQRSGACGAFCIHPAQVDVLNKVFHPDSQTIDWAEKVVVAYENVGGRGAIQVDGKMVDPPVYRQAKLVISLIK